MVGVGASDDDVGGVLLIYVGGHLNDVGVRKTCFVFWSPPPLPRSDVSDPPTKPFPCQSPNRTTGNKERANKTRRSGGAKGPIWSILCSDKGQPFSDEQSFQVSAVQKQR